MDPNQ
jgi:hypothetical protein